MRIRSCSFLFLASVQILALTLGAGPAQGQTILNTERFQLSEVEGFHVSADFSVNGQRGNSDVLNVSSSGIVGTRTGPHWIRFIFGGRFLSNEERSILDSQFGQVRYSYIVTDRTRSFHFVQAQKNESLRLRSRWLVGSGVRHTVFEGDHASLSVGAGLMGEWERLNADAVGPDESRRRDALRMANQAVYSYDLNSGARVLNILYLQPEVGDWSNLRILNDLGLLVPISSWLRVTLSAEWRRDTRPPSELERDDLSFSVSLGLDHR